MATLARALRRALVLVRNDSGGFPALGEAALHRPAALREDDLWLSGLFHPRQ